MRGGSPGEECEHDSEAVHDILSNITGITIQACMQFLHSLSLQQNIRRQHLTL